MFFYYLTHKAIKRKAFMKKIVLLLLSLSLLLSAVSCTDIFSELGTLRNDGEEYTVFFSVDGVLNETTQNGEIELPADPKKENYLFDGWFYDSACTTPLRPGALIEDGDVFYAGWTLDYEKLVNQVAADTQRANVTVYSISYNTGFFGGVSGQRAANGSGVIFKETASAYYVLTNCHVVETMEGYSHVTYKITDAYENTYENVTLVSSSAEHDLAVLKFTKGSADLSVVSLAEHSPSKGDDVLAISQPNGQKNTLSLGKCTKIDTANVEPTSGSDITFPVIYHNSPIDHGSSGGMLLNSDLELSGVTFAVAYEKESGDFVSGLSIPIENVKEFLSTVNFDK